jgi:hypothetical protein
MMLAGEKKCRPITSAGREMLAAIEHRARFAHAIQFGEHGLLHREVFEHGFDHEVGVGERIV